jgi:hypothetical protein
MKRTPMKRSGFKRAPRREPIERAERAPAQAVATVKPIRRGVIAPVTGFTPAKPKTKAMRNSHLREMAQGRPCLLAVPGVCCGDWSTTVCCHSNLSIHGKGGARKAEDFFSAWGCVSCHRWLDQGPADAVLKEMTFMRAHLAQVLEWRAIAFDTTQPERDRRAARWALDHLNATPIGAAA